MLVRDQLASYLDNPTHKRVKLLHLTPAGTQALHSIRGRQRRWANRVGAALNAPALCEAVTLLNLIEQALAADLSIEDTVPSANADA